MIVGDHSSSLLKAQKTDSRYTPCEMPKMRIFSSKRLELLLENEHSSTRYTNLAMQGQANLTIMKTSCFYSM